MRKGKIIFLNGAPSVGKTSLAKVLQEKLDEPYYWLNVDSLIQISDANPMTYFEKGKDPVSLFPHMIKQLTDLGVNVKADAAFKKDNGRIMYLAEETLKQCVYMLHNYPILHVLVTCPLEERMRRERKRGYTRTNLYEIDFDGAYDIYDIRVETYNNSLEECAVL